MGCQPNSQTVQLAVVAGHVEVLQWAHEEHSLQFGASHLGWAARYGHRACFKYMLSQRCAVSVAVCVAAAAGPHSQMLQQLVEVEHCELTAQMTLEATIDGRAHNFINLRFKQCPIVSPYRVYSLALTTDCCDIMDYMWGRGDGITAQEATELLQLAGAIPAMQCARWLWAHNANLPESLEQWTQSTNARSQ